MDPEGFVVNLLDGMGGQLPFLNIVLEVLFFLFYALAIASGRAVK